jgi:signal transduction histidine kinase/acetolactate synthase small subunit
MSGQTLNFKVSSGLKNIVGSDLISDDFIAVFELVKNSFDAHAENVEIRFDKGKITITDDGKGMDFSDIENKWLWLGYSAKKEGEEDDELKEERYVDYREKITPASYFAGAKGIGRFSCDRLGQILLLTSRKVGTQISEQLRVDWGRFDIDPKVKFEVIDIEYLGHPKVPKLANGTILEITSLRSSWDERKIMDLKRSLEKLINPFDVIDRKRAPKDKTKRRFEILISDPSQEEKDLERDEYHKVNGPVQNFVFETLDIKTTQIFTEISANGTKITTELIDRGEQIYKISEVNTEYSLLSNIRFHVYYLNRSAKLNFRAQMGIASVAFGSIFLYKNGFRVYPFGEEGEDSFGLDRRKQQGTKRYLGTREVVGRIEIYGNDEEFKETSSRDGGLKDTPSYRALEDCFKEKCLRRLERYVVDIQWALKDQSDDFKTVQNQLEAKAAIAGIISKLVNSENVRLEKYNKDFLSIVSDKLDEVSPLDETFDNLEGIALKANDRNFHTEIKTARKRYAKLVKEKEEAEEKARKEEEARKKAEEELEAERKENLFNKKIAGQDIKEVVSLQHHIDRASEKIDRNIDQLIEGINNDDPKSHLLKFVEKISLENKKISTVAQFVTNANFNLKATTITKDINRFIKNYIENVHQEYEHLKLNKQLLKVVVTPSAKPYQLSFKPLEIIMIIDNLFSNSYKAKSKHVTVTLKTKGEKAFQIAFEDDGQGISDNVLPRIFNLGFTTTSGSGIGLFHVKQIVDKMKGEIEVDNSLKKGVRFTITFYKHET